MTHQTTQANVNANEEEQAFTVFSAIGITCVYARNIKHALTVFMNSYGRKPDSISHGFFSY